VSEIDRLAVIGLGYIGLPTAAAFANTGIEVLGVDVRESVVESLSRGRVHIFEPGLDELVSRCVQEGRLKVSLQPSPCDAFIVAVPTPFKEGYVPDLSYIDAATASIAPLLRAGNLIILESTSPVGTTERMARQLADLRSDLYFPTSGGSGFHNVHVAHCPEHVLPGNILRELTHNHRVVGGICGCCTEKTITLYERFVKGECLATNAKTAEMVKLAENAFRDVNIGFANELSLIAHRLGLDVTELIALANRHPRVKILKPGPGVGGHCIAVDPWFIVHTAPEEARLIRTARSVNDAKCRWVADQILEAARARGVSLVGCLGLSYKANVDDVRESPSIAIVKRLRAGGIRSVLVHDPFVKRLPSEIAVPGVTLAGLDELLSQADVVALLTDHRAYASIEPRVLEEKTVIDPTGMWHGLQATVRGATKRAQEPRRRDRGPTGLSTEPVSLPT